MTRMALQFVLGNTNTSIYHADRWSLWVLDRELRYPTSVATAKEAGFQAPGNVGEWDGWISLLHQPKTMQPYFPTGLLGRVRRLCRKMQIPYVVEDARQKPSEGMPEFPSDGQTIIDREYQIEAETRALEVGRGVLNMPPRSGKTRTMLSIVGKLGLPTIWVVPTDAIAQQTVRACETFYGKHFAHHQVGAQFSKEQGAMELHRAVNSRVIVCTAATAVRLPPEIYNSRECLVVDEWHHSAAKTYREIMKLCDHIYYRFGMTGTFFRSGDDDMAMHALLSNEIYRVGSDQLLRDGYLVPTKSVYIPCDAPRLQCPKKYTEDGVEVKRVAPWLKYGVQEHTYRNQLCAYAAGYLHNILSRKVLVLVSTKEQGRRIERMISTQIPAKEPGAQFNPVEFISTDRRRATQQQILKAFNETDEVRVLVGTSLVGEGVDLPPADALVYARGGKAEVELAQNSFRVCTAWGGKKDAIIVDFADRHNKHLMRHSKQRLECFYQEPIMDVEVLPSIKFFATWCKNHMVSVAESAEQR